MIFCDKELFYQLVTCRVSTCNLQSLFCVYVCTRDQQTGHSNISAEKSMSNNIHYANLSTMAPIFPIHLSLKWRLPCEKISCPLTIPWDGSVPPARFKTDVESFSFVDVGNFTTQIPVPAVPLQFPENKLAQTCDISWAIHLKKVEIVLSV